MKITIIGTGFAALTAVREVRKKLKDQATIQVISPTDKFIYLPSIIWIPAGLKTREDLEIDLHNFFNRQKVIFTQARVTGVSNQGRTVNTDQGDFENDALIIASGGRFIKRIPGIENIITPCEGIAAAEAIKEKLESLEGGTLAIGFGGNPKEPSAMRGGPMFEFMLGIDTLLRRQKRRDKFEIVFFNPAAEPGKRMGKSVPSKILPKLEKQGIKTHLGHKIVEFQPNKVITEGGEIEADMILFMPGMTGPDWLENSELPKSAGGMIKANEFTEVEGFDKVYVAGDSGSFPGPEWQPKQAHAADLQAQSAAHNLAVALQGTGSKKPIKHELVCIIDSLSHGVLVKRSEKSSLMLPPCRLMHYAKRFFETLYLRKYR